MGALSPKAALVAQLRAGSALAALVSARIYPANKVPQGAALPYVTYYLVSEVHEHDMSGAAGLAHERFQIDGYATSETGVEALRDALRNAVDGFRGTITVGSDSISIRSMLIGGGGDTTAEVRPGSETAVSSCRFDVNIWHIESVPTFS